jgi:hypothetical protein
MALTFTDITAPVGIRNGQTTMPNKPGDLAIVTDLFDRMKRLISALHNGFKESRGWTTHLQFTNRPRKSRGETISGSVRDKGE